MKTLFRLALPAIVAGLLFTSSGARAQDVPDYHKDLVTSHPNPTAGADIALVRAFLGAYFKNDGETLRSLVGSGYVSYGPGSSDSTDLEKTITTMAYNVRTRSDVRHDLIFHTFEVKTGPEQGMWVAVWGQCSFVQFGQPARFPFHYVAQVADGKIRRDIIYFDRIDVARQLGYSIAPSLIVTK